MTGGIQESLIRNNNLHYSPKMQAQAQYNHALNQNAGTDTFVKQVKSQLPFTAVFEGIPLINFLRRNKKLNSEMTPVMKEISRTSQEAFKNIFTGKEGSLLDRIGAYIKTANENKALYGEVKEITKARAKLPKLVQKAAKAGRSRFLPEFLNNYLKNRAADKLNTAQNTAAKIVSPSAAKAGSFSVRNFLKASNAKFMLGFSAFIEGISTVYPAFKQLGFVKGVKQLVKSAVKVTGDTAGFIAGETIGTALGTAIGTAVCPVIGTAIGSAIGFISGCLGCHYAGKLTQKITGKSEIEIADENKKAAEIEAQSNPFLKAA